MKKLPLLCFFAACTLAALATSGCQTAPASALERTWCASPRGSIALPQSAVEPVPCDELVEQVWRSSPRGTATCQTVRLLASTRELHPVPHAAPPVPPAPEPLPVVSTDGGISHYVGDATKPQ